MAKKKNPVGATKKPKNDIANFGGGGGGGNGKPSENYSFKEEKGRLHLLRDGVDKPVANFSTTGTVISEEVTTGVGSFKLGGVHSVSSAGKAVVFQSGFTGTTIIPLACKFMRKGKELEEPFQPIFDEPTDVEPLGINSPEESDIVQAIWNFTPDSQAAILGIAILAEEEYVGPVVLSIYDAAQAVEIYRSPGKMVLTKGEICNAMLDIPCFMDNREVIVSLNKVISHTEASKAGVTYEEGISCRASALNKDAPYVKLLVRRYEKETLIRQADLRSKVEFYIADLTGQEMANLNLPTMFLYSSSSGDQCEFEVYSEKDRFGHFYCNNVHANGYYYLYYMNEEGAQVNSTCSFLTKMGETTVLTCSSFGNKDASGNLIIEYRTHFGDDVSWHLEDKNRHLSKQDRHNLDNVVSKDGKVTVRIMDKGVMIQTGRVVLEPIDRIGPVTIEKADGSDDTYIAEHVPLGSYQVNLQTETGESVNPGKGLSDIILVISAGCNIEVVKPDAESEWMVDGERYFVRHFDRRNPMHIAKGDRRLLDQLRPSVTVNLVDPAFAAEWNACRLENQGNGNNYELTPNENKSEWTCTTAEPGWYVLAAYNNTGNPVGSHGLHKELTLINGSNVRIEIHESGPGELMGTNATLSEHLANTAKNHIAYDSIVNVSGKQWMGTSTEQWPSCYTVNAIIEELPVYTSYTSGSYSNEGLSYSVFTMRDSKDKWVKHVVSIGAAALQRNAVYKVKLPVHVSMSDSWVTACIASSASLGGVQQSIYPALEANSPGNYNIATDMSFNVVSNTPGILAANGRIQFIIEGKRP